MVKEPLRKVLGKAMLTFTEMQTVLTDIEAMINSRPLSYIGDDIDDGAVITPAHLAIGRPLGCIPDVRKQDTGVSLSQRYRYQQRVLNHFWQRWLREYLPTLNMRQKWLKEHDPLKVGDVVLMTDDNLPRSKWNIGKIETTFKGKDGIVRTVTVKTKAGLYRRPVQKLHLLERFQ